MTYDQMLESYHAKKNFRVPWRDLALARDGNGYYILDWSQGKHTVFGRPVVKMGGHFLVFMRCERCGNTESLNQCFCGKCGAEQ